MAQQSFAQWMYNVDKYIQGQLGLTSNDLPDYGYRDAWEDDLPPRTAARKAIRFAEGM